MSKRGLGRGLGALLSSAPTEGDVLVEVSIDQVEPNPHQPRKSFDSKSLEELTASIRTSGLIQPIVVRQVGGRYQLIAGERRWRAARQAGLEHVPAIVREATDAESLELALVENLLRDDLNPMEGAEAYQHLLTRFGWTQEQLAQRIGLDRTSIANALRLLKLPEVIQDDLRAGRLAMGHARALLALDSVEEQLKLRDQILAQDLSVRATETSVRASDRSPAAARTPRRRRGLSPELSALQQSLQRALMTRVLIAGNEQRGAIEITYATPEELERLTEHLLR
jgi:ParB family chromosome partitioning protein